MESIEPTLASRSFVRTLLLVLAGPITWGLHFGVVYGTHALTCVQGPSELNARSWIGLETLVALAGLALVVWRSKSIESVGRHDQTQAFLWKTTLVLSVLSASAIAWAGSAVLFLPACQGMR